MPLRIMMDARKPSIRLTGAIDMATAHELVDEMTLLFDYYRFRTVLLKIESPGGDADALNFIVNSLSEWRKGDDRVLETEGLTEVASAAAMLLSLGTLGHRSAHSYSRLLYHSVRAVLARESHHTYSELKSTGKRLEKWDHSFLDMLTEHTAPQRASQDSVVYKRRLKKLFSQERFISASEACDLNLIDRLI